MPPSRRLGRRWPKGSRSSTRPACTRASSWDTPTSCAGPMGIRPWAITATKWSTRSSRRSAKAKFIIQLCLYSDLLADAQGLLPQWMHVVLGDGTEESFRVANYFRYFRAVKARFLERLGGVLPETYPEACAHCALCRWRDLCRARWERDDHLNQVANITAVQIERLQDAGGSARWRRLRASPPARGSLQVAGCDGG